MSIRLIAAHLLRSLFTIVRTKIQRKFFVVVLEGWSLESGKVYMLSRN